MQIVKKISVGELKDMAKRMYGDLVKADVDIARKILIVDMGMHADGEAELLANGSKQDDIWGINLHPDDWGTADFIEYDSMINIRPSQKNPTRGVLDKNVRQKIADIVNEVVHD